VVIFVMSRGVLLVAFNEGMEIDLTYGSYWYRIIKYWSATWRLMKFGNNFGNRFRAFWDILVSEQSRDTLAAISSVRGSARERFWPKLQCQLAHASILISSSRARPKPRESITSSRRSHPLVLPPLTKESPCAYNSIKRSREWLAIPSPRSFLLTNFTRKCGNWRRFGR
jgi:hypothetical protein